MTIFQIFEYYWFMNTPALILAAVIIILYWWINGFRFTGKSILFFDGIILFIFAVCSPLDYLGRYYLFSAHMTEHVILLLIVPPLFLCGIEMKNLNKFLSMPYVKNIAAVIFHPAVAWTLGVGVMWFWHIPSLFNEMNHSHSMHIYNMISLVMAGVIFMWPVFGSVGFGRLQPLQSAVYLFLACIGCTLLGMYITFSPDGIFTSYVYEVDPELFYYIHSDWGITSAVDQQFGGLIMWVPACTVYLTNIMVIIIKWLQTAETKESFI